MIAKLYSGRGSIRRRAFALAAALLMAGCFSYPVNPALTRYEPTAGYRFCNRSMGPGNTDRNFVIVTLSGGGTRAAAFAYGALRQLEETPIGDSGFTLLDEVDLISSVSGGSFAAGYYGVYGKEAFLRTFPDDVLYRKIERDLILRLACPWFWPRLLSPWYGRSDLVDAYYDRYIFGGARFRDLPMQRPLIQLNATDISLGASFAFVQDDFDRLCSDLSAIRVSRAVTASSAFPVAFTPLTFENYPSGRCGYCSPPWVGSAVEDLNVNPTRYDRALDWKSYEDPHRPFIHMSDGGLADNIGLRGPMLGLTSTDSPLGIIRRINEQRIERLVLVIVDAKPEGAHKLDRSARPPGIFNVLNAAATNPMENYSTDTVELSRTFIDEWNRDSGDELANLGSCLELAEDVCAARSERSACEKRTVQKCFDLFEVEPGALQGKIEFHRIYVRFAAVKDPKKRHELQRIPTRLQLPRKDVDLLIETAAELVRTSEDFAKVATALGKDARAPEAMEQPACPPLPPCEEREP